MDENGVAWPQAAPVHVKTKSAWATNSAMGGGAVRISILAFPAAEFPAFPRAFRDDRRSQGAVSARRPRAVKAVVARRRLTTLTDGVAARRVKP